MRFRPFRLVLVVLAASALGLAWNEVSGRGLDLGANAYLRPGDQEIPAGEARDWHTRGALFLDARPVAFYNMSHIPGALPLPEDDFEPWFAKLEPRLRSSLDIVVYCSGFGCEASHLVTRRLKDKGIQAFILSEGWPAWLDAGHPVKEGPEP